MQNFPSLIQSANGQPIPPMFYHATTINNNNNYNKSSSYPNFAPSANSTILNSAAALTDAVQRSLQAIGQKQPTATVQINNCTNTTSNTNGAVSQETLSSLVYRHSLNNLISLQQIQNQAAALSGVVQKSSTTIPLPLQAESILCAAGNCENSRKNELGRLSAAAATNPNGLNTSIGDINSRLEFLCLQMTEQAIN